MTRTTHPPQLDEPPRWLADGHLQTLLPAWWGRRQRPPRAWVRERWDTPDGDFVDVDWCSPSLPERPDAPLVVLFHGLEGSSQSHYAKAWAEAACNRGWKLGVVHFRGCSGELNRAPRAYHSGDVDEIQWMLARVRRTHPKRPLLAVGVSLGGNALMRWAGLAGEAARASADAVVAVSAPLDLTACGNALGQGFNRHVYTRVFLRTMLPKARAKWQQYPGLFDLQRLNRSQTLYDFDDAFTAPVHGFGTASRYWREASAKPVLRHVRLPSLIIHAANDPFVPAWCLPNTADVSADVTLWQPANGGHVGFAYSGAKSVRRALRGVWPECVMAWAAEALSLPGALDLRGL